MAINNELHNAMKNVVTSLEGLSKRLDDMNKKAEQEKLAADADNSQGFVRSGSSLLDYMMQKRNAKSGKGKGKTTSKSGFKGKMSGFSGKGGGKSGRGAALQEIHDVVLGMQQAGFEFYRNLRDITTSLTIIGINISKTIEVMNREVRNITQRMGIEINKRTIQYQQEMAVKLTEAAISAVTSSINEGAYQAYEATLEREAARQKLDIDIERERRKTDVDIQKTRLSGEIDVKKLEYEQAVTEKRYGEEAFKLGGAIVSGIAGGGMVSSYAEIAKNAYGLYKQTSEIEKDIAAAEFDKSVAEFGKTAELYENQLEYSTNIKKEKIEYELQMKKAILGLTKKIEEIIDKSDSGFTELMRSYGYMGSQLSGMRRGAITGNLSAWVSRAGYSSGDFAKIVGSYQNATGRMGFFSERDIAMSALVDKLAGESGFGGRLASVMHDFGYGVDDALSLVSKNMEGVARRGLSMRKYASDIEKNMSLANKFNFRNGVEGLMRMSERALAMKGSLESYSNILSKFSDMDLSGILETSASLNVLGGNAALFSDPLGMLYESRMDPEALVKRVQAMTMEKGTFSNGEMTYGFEGWESMKYIAKLTGRSVDDVKKELYETEKRRQLEGTLSNYDKDYQDFIAANATWSKELKGWAVNVGGNAKKVSELEAADLEKIIPETTEDDVKSITKDVNLIWFTLKNVFGLEEARDVAEKQGEREFAKGFYDKYAQQNSQRAEQRVDNVKKTITDEYDNIVNAMKGATEAYASILPDANAARATFEDNIQKGVEESVNKLREIYVGVSKYSGSDNTDKYYFIDEMSDLQYIPYNIDPSHVRFDTNKLDITEVGIALASKYAKGYETNTLGTKATNWWKEDGVEIDKALITDLTAKKEQDYASYGSNSISPGSIVSSIMKGSMSKGSHMNTLFDGIIAKSNSIGERIERRRGKGNYSSRSNGMDVNVSLDGNAEIDCGDGNSVDLVRALESDPFAMRQITQMILNEINGYSSGRNNFMAFSNVGNIFNR